MFGFGKRKRTNPDICPAACCQERAVYACTCGPPGGKVVPWSEIRFRPMDELADMLYPNPGCDYRDWAVDEEMVRQIVQEKKMDWIRASAARGRDPLGR